MKVSVNDIELFTLSETQKDVLKDQINADIFDDDMKRRLQWALMHKYQQCFDRFKKNWEPILIKEGATSIPTDQDEFAALIFGRDDYKDCKAREEEQELV